MDRADVDRVEVDRADVDRAEVDRAEVDRHICAKLLNKLFCFMKFKKFVDSQIILS